MRKRALDLSNYATQTLVDAGTDVNNIHAAIYVSNLDKAEELIKEIRRDFIASLREIGYTWEMIADVLYITKQSAWERFH